jgi:glycosyltransferase involved in cell wall biosynthesis
MPIFEQKLEDRQHLGRTKKKVFFFGFSLDLDKFLTLKNANLFVFSSLNRNFALSLHPQTNY